MSEMNIQATDLLPDDQKFECIGKGGEYTVVAAALGAGTLRQHDCMFVYKNADGIHFVRTHDDFFERMREINPSAEPAIKMTFARSSEAVAWRRFDGEGNFDYWDDEENIGGNTHFEIQPLFTAPDALGRTFDDGIACAFDLLMVSAANTSDLDRGELLEGMAADIIEHSPKYKKQWRDICDMGSQNAALKAENEELSKARVPAGLYRELVALRELRDQAKAYMDSYLLDEVEDAENCISEDQHLSASALSERLMDAFQAHWDSAMSKASGQ